MITYLKSGVLPKPATISTSSSSDPKAAVGRVTSTIKHGEIFLHSVADPARVYRLRWEREGKDRARAVPIGKYRVSGYRHVASAKDGVQWIWSTTSPGYAEIEVTADEPTHFAVRDSLDVKVRALERRGKRRVSLVFVAEKRLGNTLYRAGKRIAIKWECLDAESTVVASGAMRYG